MCWQLHSKNDQQNRIRLPEFRVQKYSGYSSYNHRAKRFQKNRTIVRWKKIISNSKLGLIMRSDRSELQRASSNPQRLQVKRPWSIRLSQQWLQARTRIGETNNWIRKVEIRSWVSNFRRSSCKWKGYSGGLQISKIELLLVWQKFESGETNSMELV